MTMTPLAPAAAHSTAKIKAKVTREEQAARELGVTEFARGTRATLVIVFLAAIAAVPLAQVISAIHQRERLSRLADGLRSLAPGRDRIEAVNGVISAVNLLPTAEQIKAVEDDWERNSIVGEMLLPRVQSLMLLLGQGNEKAYVGRDGWLFYRPDLDYVTGKPFMDAAVLKQRARSAGGARPPQPDPVKAILDFRDQLEKRGIKLIVMPAPMKPSIHPEFYSAGYSAGSRVLQNASFEPFKRRLADAEVNVFDPAALLAGAKSASADVPLYLKTDTHWTPSAMELTAGKLAEMVRSAAKLPEKTSGRFSVVARDVENLGDIAMMLKLPPDQTAFARQSVRVRQVLDNNCFWRPAPKAEVLFLGDSFANIFSLEVMGWGESAGLAEHLSLALGLPVDVICRNDAGSHATREMLAAELKRGNDRLAGKKVVIWEFAARELSWGDWKLIPMTVGEKKATGFYAPAAGRTVEIRGVVQAISPAPRPGSVTYKDHIFMVHLADIQCADDPAAAGKQAVVFTWSMRDHKAAPATRWRPGDTIRIRVQPWLDVAAKYEAINRSSLDDEEIIYADPGWTEEVSEPK